MPSVSHAASNRGTQLHEGGPVSDNPKGYVNPQQLITTQALSERLAAGSATPVLLDLRPTEVFAAGHIPGAVHFDCSGSV